jgi:hypothetical protein
VSKHFQVLTATTCTSANNLQHHTLQGHTDQQVQAAAAAAGVNLIQLMSEPLPLQPGAVPGTVLPTANVFNGSAVPVSGGVVGGGYEQMAIVQQQQQHQQQQQSQQPPLSAAEAALRAAAAVNAKFGVSSAPTGLQSYVHAYCRVGVVHT